MLLTFSWEQRRLGEVCEIIMGQSPSSNNYSSEPCGYILVQGNADIEDGWVTPRVWTTEITKIGKCNDIIMSVRAPAGSVGRTKYDVVLGRGVAAIKGNNFVYRQLEKMEFCRYWKRLASGSTFESLSTAHLKSATIAIPEGREQMMIGNFFELLDHYITVQQRKLVSKDEVMNLFLCKSNTLVDVDVYANSWEQRRLGEIAIRIGDGLHGTPEYSDKGEVSFINGNNLIDGKILTTQETKKVLPNKQSRYDKELNENTILMSINGTIGSLAWYRNEKVMLGKSVAYIEISKLGKKFIYAYLQTCKVKSYFKNSLTGTTIKNLGLKSIRETPIYFGNIEEQQKIGQLFELLDHHITFQQRM